MPALSTNLQGALLSLAAFGVYATHDLLIKFLGSSYSPVQLIFYSVLLGFPLVTVMLMSDRTDGNLFPRHPWWTLLRSGTGVINALTGFYAFSVLPLAQVYAIVFAMPILITLMAIPLLGERIGMHRGIAVVVGLLGVLIVLQPEGSGFSLGHLAALVAAMMGATTSVIVRKIGKEERSIVLMLYPMVANFVVMVMLLPFVYVPMPIEHLGLLALMSALGVGGGLFLIAAYRRAPAVIVAPMQYSQIVWAIIFGWLFFSESIDGRTAIGTAVIIASGIYIVLREDKPSVSRNRPVTEGPSRYDTASIPKSSIWNRVFDRRKPDPDQGTIDVD
jgi:S-adenosylmethionine uptake transporter